MEKTTPRIQLLALLISILTVFALACSSSQPQQESDEPGKDLPYMGKSFDLDVRWGASPRTVMKRLFQLADLKATDVFYDLGCGDGRVVIEAVKQFGLLGKGVDIDPARIIQSRERAALEGVEKKAKFLNESFFDSDITDATVVFIFLNNDLNRKLRPRFLRLLKPGSRIIMHTHDMGEWEPDVAETVKCECVTTGKLECYRTARLYTVPANATGTWRWSGRDSPESAVFSQKFQEIRGHIRIGGETITPGSISISGEIIDISLFREGKTGVIRHSYLGSVRGDKISGYITITGNGTSVIKEWNARRDKRTMSPIDF